MYPVDLTDDFECGGEKESKPVEYQSIFCKTDTMYLCGLHHRVLCAEEVECRT